MPIPIDTQTEFQNGTLATLTYLEYQEQNKGANDAWFPMEKDCLTKILAAFPFLEQTITEERRKKILSLVSKIEMG